MIKYSLSQENPQRQFIQFHAEFPHDGNERFALELPSWRPGRYELGNFAKNIKNFKVTDKKGKPIPFSKTTKDSWKIEAAGHSIIHVDYSYYSAELNGGSTFLNEETMYVNPVNCFMYRPGFEEVDRFSVELNLPDKYILASPLAEKTKKNFVAKNVHELMDSPFMASASLEYHSFNLEKITFHIWINGKHSLDLNEIEADFIPFCNAQIRDFNGFPQDDYLFMFHFLAQPSYHGVEHEKCTVITLGPAEELLTRAFYEELLGVSSHELYHTWNVKALRPNDMLPYDYKKENYSELGYVYEGVTTYMGDWYLLNSGVFNFQTYAKHLGNYLNRHFQNQGRFNYSVAESSFDTWLDGYMAGAPGRKTSIYTEGCLVAFISDLMILTATNGRKNLASAMLKLWNDFGAKGEGYSANDYFHCLESVSKLSFSEIRTQLVYSVSDFRPFLEAVLDPLGMKLTDSPNSNKFTSKVGIKLGEMTSGEFKIIDIAEGSPADTSGIHQGDTVIAINGTNELTSDVLTAIDYEGKVELKLNHMGNITSCIIVCAARTFFDNVQLEQLTNRSESQLNLFNQWSGDK